MSHEVESMFYVGDEPWHGIGHRFEVAPSSVPEAMDAAGLSWEVGLAPLEVARLDDDKVALAGVFPAPGSEVSHKAVYRADTGAILGCVGPAYTPLQNASALGWFEPFIQSGLASFETAGSLREGRRVFALARVLSQEPLEVSAGDRVALYILLSHAHDGTLAVHAGFTPIRVVCANTLRMALMDGGSQLIRLKHTKNVEAALAQVAQIMDVGAGQFRATVDQYRALRALGCNPADLERYVLRVFEPGAGVKDPKVKAACEQRLLAKVEPLFFTGRGAELAGASWFGAYNAVTEYLQHERRAASPDARLDSAWFGQGAQLNTEALSLAVEMSGVAA